MIKKKRLNVTAILLCIAAVLTQVNITTFSYDETYIPEPDSRVTVNLGDIPWKFHKGDIYPGGVAASYDDSGWETVGIPHSYNDDDTYVNFQAGFQYPVKDVVIYRTHFTVDSAYQGSKVIIEFEGVNHTAGVYINGNFIPSTSAADAMQAQPGQITHVGGMIPFACDVTDYVNFGGDNVLAVRCSNKDTNWSGAPGFGAYHVFGMGWGGIYRPVKLHIMNKIYVPLNVYAGTRKWGTYVATVSADSSNASIRVQTNVCNETGSGQSVTEITKICDADNNVVLTMQGTEYISAGESYVFDQTGNIADPHLWYPNTYGGQYMYKVYHIIQVDGATVDVAQSPLGIRTITWDADYPYVNGKKVQLWGYGQRYEYPALGAAVPEEQQWRDVKLMAESGGRWLRPGHNPCSPETVAACDAYGVALAQPSGDDEYKFQADLIGTKAWEYKKEFHRDIMILYRNNPSIFVWETANGGMREGMITVLNDIAKTWDPVNTRKNSPRGNTPDMNPADNIMGYVNQCGDKEGYPDWNAESWVSSSARHAYDYEVLQADKFIDEWNKNTNPNVWPYYKGFAFTHWYLAEPAGENFNYLETDKYHVRSLGTSAMDGNRIPKLLYNVWKNALWIPYSQRPGVVIGNHWNRSGTVQVDAYSNCPSVELFINGVSRGTRTPNANTGKCSWANITWESGTLRAEGKNENGQTVCVDEKVTSGAPARIELSMEPTLYKPDGTAFQIRANASDCGFILAKVVDTDGNLCYTYNDNITFSVSGPAEYRGSYDIYITDNQPLSYHAPTDPTLQVEGGLRKVAVRSTFTAGTIAVTASCEGLPPAQIQFDTIPVESYIPPETPKPSSTPSPTPSPTPTPTPAPVGINLAFQKPAMASSEEGSNNAVNKAFDGYPYSRWASQKGIDPQWIYADLGSRQNFNRVVLNWEAAYGKSYAIQVSDDAENWTDVYTTTAGDGGIDDISFNMVCARYVRMYGTQRGTSYGYSLWEFEVYESPVEPNFILSYETGTAAVETNIALSDAKLILASYEDDKLIDILIFNVNTDAGSKEGFPVMDFMVSAGGQIKLMLWGGIDKIYPMTNEVIQAVPPTQTP